MHCLQLHIAKKKKKKKNVHHCPDPQTIEEYYSSSPEGFSISIQEDSLVCSMCCHAQLVIVKRQRLTSYDSDFQILIDSLCCDKLAAGKDTECIKLLAASMVGNGLLEQRAMLLVDIYNFSTNTATDLGRLYTYLPNDILDVGSL